MRKLLTGVQRLKMYAVLLILGLTMGCESWDLPLLKDSLSKGLIAYYPMNGSPSDLSGNGLNSLLINGATYGPNRDGTAQSALQLDGIDDYFEIPDNAKLRPDSISISLWLKAKKVVDYAEGGGGGTRHIYYKGEFSAPPSVTATHNQQYNAFISNPKPPISSTVCCEISVDVNNEGSCLLEEKFKNRMGYHDPTYELNRWYHFVSVFSGQILKLYINGELKASQMEKNPINNCIGGNLRFGAARVGDENYFNGWMDEIRIYNRGLTQAEITALYKR